MEVAEMVCSSMRLGLRVLKGAMDHRIPVVLHYADCLLE